MKSCKVKSLHLVLVALIGVFWSGGAVWAGSIVYNNLGPGDTYNLGQGATVCNSLTACFAADEDTAAGFTPAATYTLDTISIAVGLTSGLNLLDVFLETNSPCNSTCGSWNGVPSNSVIEAFHFIGAMGPFGSANPLLVATSTLHPVLQANTLYWVVVDGIDGSGISAGWSIFPLNLGPEAQIGGSGQPQWTAVTGQTALKVTGDLVPEPGSLALMGLGAAGLVAIRRRSKWLPQRPF